LEIREDLFLGAKEENATFESRFLKGGMEEGGERRRYIT